MSAQAGGGGGYAQMPLMQLQQLVQQTQQAAQRTLPPLGTFFTQAVSEFGNASASLRAAMDKTVPTWLDAAGQAHADAGDAGHKAIQQNAQSIQDIKPEELLQGVVTGAGTAAAAVQKAIDELQQAGPLAMILGMMMPNPQAGAAVESLAQQMKAAAQAIQGARPQSPWKIAPGGNTGTSSQSGGGDQSGADQSGGQAGGDQAGGDPAGAGQSGGDQTGAGADQAGAGSGADGSMTDGPSLQGTGTSVLPPPTITPPSSVPPLAASPQSGLGMPMMPISPVLPVNGGSVPGLVSGVKTSGGKFGGVPVGGVPGVGLAGAKSIPLAAHPTSQPAGASVGAEDDGPEPPIIAQEPSAPSSGGGFGGVPMMPMTGGFGGVGGGGGTPGSGAVRRPPGGRGRGRAAPPGLPSQLQGKAGATERESFAPLHKQSRRSSDPDVTTLQILDEELWQVDQPTGQALTDRPADAPRRRAH